ncbi:peptidoglycan-binding domain-containing protein [Streptomyces sp. NPDC002215]|uniref:peptidoglycan-binding domain-containing protein n=1 Tax=Streptomyces sp. NPDC002215 TaxID=3154412 RepID=UPI003322BC61
MAKGMVGSKVKQIQCLLNSNYDYTLTVDGKFGESTDVAVRAVQRCSGLNPDGQVGPQTWKYLDTPMSGCGHWRAIKSRLPRPTPGRKLTRSGPPSVFTDEGPARPKGLVSSR